MNSKFVAHKQKDSYKLSRGVVVFELLKTDLVKEFVSEFDFDNIKPFMVLLLDWQEQSESI